MNHFSHPLVKYIEIFSIIDSTFSLSERYIKEKKYEGNFLIIAEQQSNGRGRKGNQWISNEGGLWFNLNLAFISAQAGFTLFIGYCIAKSLNKLLDCSYFKIKWPNDIYYYDVKVCGIICSQYLQFNKTLIGVGINTNNIIAETQNINANSIKDLTGKYYPNEIYLETLLTTISEEIQLFSESGVNYFIDSYNDYDYLKGKIITITNYSQTSEKSDVAIISGVYKGISTDGALIINSEGVNQAVYSGSVILKNENVK